MTVKGRSVERAEVGEDVGATVPCDLSVPPADQVGLDPDVYGGVAANQLSLLLAEEERRIEDRREQAVAFLGLLAAWVAAAVRVRSLCALG